MSKFRPKVTEASIQKLWYSLRYHQKADTSLWKVEVLLYLKNAASLDKFGTTTQGERLPRTARNLRLQIQWTRLRLRPIHHRRSMRKLYSTSCSPTGRDVAGGHPVRHRKCAVKCLEERRGIPRAARAKRTAEDGRVEWISTPIHDHPTSQS